MKVKNKIILTCVTILGLQCVANAGSLYSENYSPEIVVKYLNEQSTELEKLRGEMVSLRSEVSKLKQENLQLTSHLKEVISAVNASFQEVENDSLKLNRKIDGAISKINSLNTIDRKTYVKLEGDFKESQKENQKKRYWLKGAE